MAIIFERKTILYNGEDKQVFKAIDLDSGGFGKNKKKSMGIYTIKQILSCICY